MTLPYPFVLPLETIMAACQCHSGLLSGTDLSKSKDSIMMEEPSNDKEPANC